jgi:zinc/manganese transport system substrate-binding protein
MYSGLKGGRAGAAIGVVVLLVVAALVGIYLTQRGSAGTTTSSNVGGSSSVIQVVAGENFWGSLAAQLGGSHANVVSIVTDPNADPHEYEANPKNATAVADANLVIMNGVGYDDWLGQLVNASNTPGQTVLNVANVLGANDKNVGVSESAKFSNEHFWYNPVFVNMTVHAMYNDYVKIDPADTAYYQQQYKTLNASLYGYMKLEAQIKAQYGGTNIACTETICLYLANATGLNVLSPFEFMKAIAEGTDPSAQDVVTFTSLLTSQPPGIKVLIYNNQTITQITDNMKATATQNHIPITWVTETMVPPNGVFQDWMTTELTGLQNALKGQ